MSHMAFAAEHSADTMILDWRTEKVWMEHGELCVRGTFYNRRSDLTVTKLDEMILQITFTGTDGKICQYEIVVRNNVRSIVAGLPVTRDGDFLINRQFRIPLGRYVFENTAGLVDE